MANTFEQHGVPNYDADTHLNNPENKEANKPSASPTHHAEFSGTAPSADEVITSSALGAVPENSAW